MFGILNCRILNCRILNCRILNCGIVNQIYRYKTIQKNYVKTCCKSELTSIPNLKRRLLIL